MPEAAVADQTTTTATTTTGTNGSGTESLGWRAGLPDPLKQDEALVPFKTVGDFATNYLELRTKAKDLEGKLVGSIPKLPDNATDDDRAAYYDALGRPAKASEYEFDGEDKNAPEWTNTWKSEFHNLGLTKEQAKQLSGKWNAQMNAMVKAHNDAIAKETTEAQAKLKSELGDKYDTNVELAKRLWQQHGETEFDKVFADGTGANRYTMIRFLLKMAALTGEDTSPQAGHSTTSKVPTDKEGWLNMYKNPVNKR
jgi:hypothetical protein